MTDSKHTKLPWEYFPAANYKGFAIAPKGTLPTLAAVERCGKNNLSITCLNFPGETEANAAYIVQCCNAYPSLVEALRVIGEALKEPDGGSYWPARQYLDKLDIFHDDLSGTRVLLRVAEAALKEAGEL